MLLPMSWAERSGTVALCLWFFTAGARVTVGGAVSVVWLEEADRLGVSFSCATTLGFSSVHDVVSPAAVGKGRTLGEWSYCRVRPVQSGGGLTLNAMLQCSAVLSPPNSVPQGGWYPAAPAAPGNSPQPLWLLGSWKVQGASSGWGGWPVYTSGCPCACHHCFHDDLTVFFPSGAG